MQEKFGASSQSDTIYLRKALELAKINRGFCAPNPAVGAVIVRDGLVIAAGYHLGPGLAHAEIDALQKLAGKITGAHGATVYVTLEPCCHFGRTPPCTEALIHAGVRRVVYGYVDPNPLVANKGAAALAAAGITCSYLPLAEIKSFYHCYAYWHTHKMPFVTAKIALSLDGKIAGKNGQPVNITGDALNELTHVSRKKSDAILTTIATILQDDPRLNVRSSGQVYSKPLYVLDSALRLASCMTAKIFTTAKSITVFHQDDAASARLRCLTAAGVRCVAVPRDTSGLHLATVLSIIGADGTHALWVEAGGKCFAALTRAQLLQRAIIYLGAIWLGEGTTAFAADFSLQELTSHPMRWMQFGKDALCEINLT